MNESPQLPLGVPLALIEANMNNRFDETFDQVIQAWPAEQIVMATWLMSLNMTRNAQNYVPTQLLREHEAADDHAGTWVAESAARSLMPVPGNLQGLNRVMAEERQRFFQMFASQTVEATHSIDHASEGEPIQVNAEFQHDGPLADALMVLAATQYATQLVGLEASIREINPNAVLEEYRAAVAHGAASADQ